MCGLSLLTFFCSFRRFLLRLAVHDLVIRFVHVQQDIQLVQTGGLALQLFLSGEGLCDFCLGIFHLYPHIFQLLPAGFQLCGKCRKGIVQTEDVAKQVSAEGCGMAQFMTKGDLILICDAQIVSYTGVCITMPLAYAIEDSKAMLWAIFMVVVFMRNAVRNAKKASLSILVPIRWAMGT